jgi:phosphoenolpyruvate synthase/pyruvate phosphate dikinase
MKVFNAPVVTDGQESTQTDVVSSEVYGGKAYNLAKMSSMGLNVPPGFAIGVDEVPLTADVQFLIEVVCGGFPVAVRSSAIGEDGNGYSFAGQYETVLNLGTVKQVMKAIETVRESASNERVESYQEEFGLEASGVGIVVQQMVRPLASGVMFTAEPVEGDVNLIAIEAVPGLGDKLVSGQASPDFYLIEKGSGAMVEQTTINDAVLGRRELYMLVNAGMDIEFKFGCPQDIEWAMTSNSRTSTTLYILQSRPITTI